MTPTTKEPTPTTTPVLECRGVQKRYAGSVVALDTVDLSISAGELVALIGESGSGKTTLLRLFNRLVEPDMGEVYYQGSLVRERDPFQLRRAIGYVQQEGGLLPHWNVEKNVGLVPELLGWPNAKRHERTEEVLNLVGLPAREFGHRFPRALSGGQRQRVAVARALAADPDVVLLDEPFGALDPITRSDLQEEFDRLRRQLGKTTVLVTHDLDEAFRLADRVGVLQHGKIEQLATPSELSRNPATEYVERLLARFHRESPFETGPKS